MKTQIRSILHKVLSCVPSTGSSVCVPILMYHSIDETGSPISVTPSGFARQMAFYAEAGWTTQPLAKLGAALAGGEPLPPRSFIVTFDDAFQSVITHAWPVLKKHGFGATIFLVTGRMGTYSNWTGDATMDSFPIMSWQSAGDLLKDSDDTQSFIEFGSHTVTHPFLTQCAPAQLEHEIRASQVAIQDTLGVQADTFCYPCGDYDNRVVETVRKANYASATTIFAGNRHKPDDRLVLKRVYGVDYEPLSYYALSTTPGMELYVALKGENKALQNQILRGRMRPTPILSQQETQ